ncbi:DNA polymerase Y family protein [Leucobacter sp. GX24907]
MSQNHLPNTSRSGSPPPRVIALWVPDWPIRARIMELVEQKLTPPPPDRPVALLSKNRVTVCSAAARAAGVRVGLREREAQVRCPDLELHPHAPATDERHFQGVLTAIEQIIPGVEPVRPGLCLMRARGPARYFGSEAAAAEEVLRTLDNIDIPEARVGIACGRFAAEHSARSPSSMPHIDTPFPNVHIVPEESTAAFLHGLPVERACDERLSEVLRSLGIHTLGALAALPAPAIAERFGPPGVAAHRLASGADPGPSSDPEVSPRTPPVELSDQIEFDPPIDGADTLAFACSSFADRFSQRVLQQGRVCTDIRIELVDDIGVRHERQWTHPRHFTGSDVLNRIRWQTAALPSAPERTGSGIVRVSLAPIRTARAADHEPGLWNDEADARVHHHLGRVQSLLGPEGVVSIELTGGRMLAERTRTVPWGSRAGAPGSGAGAPGSRAGAPGRSGPSMPSGSWPGALPPPLPSTVFDPPRPVELRDATGNTVGIDDDELLSTAPAMLHLRDVQDGGPVSMWSAPWPLRERWWTRRPHRFRLQIVLHDGEAWLLVHQRGSWFAEGRYD